MLPLKSEQSKLVAVGCDLLGVAVHLGLETLVKDVANALLEQRLPPLARRMAKSVVNCTQCVGDERMDPIHLEDKPFENGLYEAEIRRIKSSLRLFPKNPVMWSELARLYTYLGQKGPAIDAAKVATSLITYEPHIIRSAARVLLHFGEGEQAHRLILQRSKEYRSPWLMAAEVAHALAIDITPQNVRTGLKMLQDPSFGPRATSELASAIGTLDARAGGTKRARKLIRKSLVDPTENAIAQAAWLSRNLLGSDILGENVTASPEANAWLFRGQSKWKDSLLQARRWQRDQPFSRRPAMFGSFLASRVDDQHELAIEFATAGLRSNPSDGGMRNNLAFSLALAGKLDEASTELAKVENSKMDIVQSIVVTATRGLILYRQGKIDAGREKYNRSIAVARAAGDSREHIAVIYQALEEIRVQSPDWRLYKMQALTREKFLSQPEDAVLIGRLRKAGE